VKDWTGQDGNQSSPWGTGLPIAELETANDVTVTTAWVLRREMVPPKKGTLPVCTSFERGQLNFTHTRLTIALPTAAPGPPRSNLADILAS
jgi:hypothetical protein